MEGIPDEPGTESYLESTAKGAGGYFHSQWQNACYPGDDIPAQWNGYWRVFIPWHWDVGYRKELPGNFELEDEERVLMELHSIDEQQIYWRRRKIAKLEGGIQQFQREYPFTDVEAFNSSLTNVLIDSQIVLQCMQNGRTHKYEPIGRTILGVDVAREGDDDTCFVLRQGRVILWYRRMSKLNNVEVADAVVHVMMTNHIDHVVIDTTGGYGAGVYDILNAQGVGHKLTGINFASKAINRDRYYNRRAEMYFGLKMWLEERSSIPPKDELLVELCNITYKHDTSGDRLLLERKDEIKARIGKSTDISDAAALTFCVQSSIMQEVRDRFDPYDQYGDI